MTLWKLHTCVQTLDPKQVLAEHCVKLFFRIVFFLNNCSTVVFSTSQDLAAMLVQLKPI